MHFILLLCIAFVLSVSVRAIAQSTPNPSIDEFVSVDKEPQPLVPIGQLVQYPEVARRSGLEGVVMLRVLIGTDGSVDSVVVERSDYDVFKNAAIDAMQRAKYTPAMQNGKPLKVWTDAMIHFKLQDGDGSSNNNQSAGNSNYRQTENHPHFDFRNLIGLNIDSARDFFRMFGDLGETKEADGIHLHAENSQARIARVADGIVTGNGLTQITVVYRSQNDTDFARSAATWNARGALGSELISETAVSDLPNALMTVVADAKERTLRIELKSK
jgi:TonB family protein